MLDVIARSQEADTHGDLVKYLLMVRKKVKDSRCARRLTGSFAPASCSVCHDFQW